MKRTTRAVIAFAFGALLVLGGLSLGMHPVSAAVWWAKVPPIRPDYDAFHTAEWFGTVARFCLAGGLAIEGLALLGWILAPRDDR